MQLTFTDSTTKEKLTISTFKAEIGSDFKMALGKDPDNHRYLCDDEDRLRIWPVKFSLIANGAIDTAKDGRLRVTISGSYTLEKGKAPENKGGFRIALRRETTDQDLGGFVAHDRIGAMVRAKADQLAAPALAAVLSEITSIRKAEDVASSAHAARARVAGTVIDAIKKG